MPPDIERATVAAVTRRVLPFLMICYLVAFIDRVNVGFAALEMNKDLGFSPLVYGWGAGIFFLGYFFFEVPSNLLMQRVGARLWIARIMISWGIVAAGTAFITGTLSFYTVRFVLGVAEAGFFPGIILYLTLWFPAKHRARIIGIFMVAIPASSFLGSPISGALLGLDGMLGLHGWQWLFILEAIPAVILGVVTLWVLPSRPNEAQWLSAEQRTWLVATLQEEATDSNARTHVSLTRLLTDARVLVLALVYSGSVATNYGLTLWQPQILKTFGYSNFVTGVLNALPFFIGSIAMVLWGRRSDRTRERVWHTAIALFVSAVGLGACVWVTALVPTMLALCLALVGCYALKGPFWAISTEWLSTQEAPAGIAQINAIGNLAGFVGPFLIGWIKNATGRYDLALLPLIALAVTAGLAMLLKARSMRTAPRGTTVSAHAQSAA
jgi:D-galactonate transporter